MKTTQIERMENTLIEAGYGSIYNEWDLKRMLFLLDYDSGYYNDVEKLIEAYEDVELYEVSSFEQLAEDMVGDAMLFGDIPNNIANYIDYEKLGRDLSFDGYYEVEIDGLNYIGRHL